MSPEVWAFYLNETGHFRHRRQHVTADAVLLNRVTPYYILWWKMGGAVAFQ